VKTDKQITGKWGENLAEQFLIRLGYQIVARNYFTRYGEIDLIMRQPAKDYSKNDSLVFVEVKTRKTQAYGYPEESITNKKTTALVASIQVFLQDNPGLDCDWRIDVVAIRKMGKKIAPEIVHYINAIVDDQGHDSY